MKTSLVTGGAGFIGSHIVDKLIFLGHRVVVLDNESAECHESFYWNDKAENYKYDVTDYKLIEPFFKDVDYVFHTASDARVQPSIKNPLQSFIDNSKGIANILELSRINKVKRVVFSSSSSIYGKNSVPNIETQTPDPLTPYSVAKLSGERLCKIYYDLYGLQTISLRYFNVYGERQPLKGPYAPVIGLFLKQLKNSEPLTIVGDGSQKRSFTHVSDIVEANIVASIHPLEKHNFGEIFNIGPNYNLSIRKIANLISDNQIFIEDRPGESKETLSNTDKALSILGWSSKIKIEEYIKSQV
jgi:UDP-glucose 4-epimerase